VAKRRRETPLFDLVSILSEATRDDACTVRVVSELIRQGRAFDARGIALQLAPERAARPVQPPPASQRIAGGT